MKREEVIEQKVRVYKRAYHKYGAGPEAHLWHSQSAVDIRYANLMADIDFSDKSIFEVGCGALGGIIPYLQKVTSSFSYTGCDIVPEFIEESKTRYPEHTFLCGDFEDVITPHDVVVCSGAISNNVDGNDEEREHAIWLMFANSNVACSVNMLGNHPQPKNYKTSTVYYADSLAIADYTSSLTSKFILRQHYRNNDFTIILFR